MKRNTSWLVLSRILSLVSCNIPNPSESTTETLFATTSTSSPADSTFPTPITGDLGFGKVSGQVTDSATGAPIAGATVTCKHFSYTSKESDRCNRNTTTDQEGSFLFENVFFHDTDTITLIIEATGYKPASLKNASFTQPLLESDIKLSQGYVDRIPKSPDFGLATTGPTGMLRKVVDSVFKPKC
jgi:carboxypeptidase family protein